MRKSKLGTKQSEETRKKRSESLKGHIVSKEARLKISASRIGNKNPMYGTKKSQETINKLIVKLKGHIVSSETRRKIGISNGKSVLQRDITTNEIINIFVSASEAGRVLNICNSQISAVCIGKRKTCGGFKWEYLKQGNTESDEINVVRNA